MAVVRAHTQPVGLRIDYAEENLHSHIDNLAEATTNLIESSGVEEALSYTYQPSSSRGSVGNASLLLYKTTMPQFVRISCEDNESFSWSAEAQIATKPIGVHEGVLSQQRLGVLSMVDNIQFRMTNKNLEVLHLTRLLEYAPNIVTQNQARDAYPNCYRADYAIRSIAQGIQRIRRRGQGMNWHSKEWSIE